MGESIHAEASFSKEALITTRIWCLRAEQEISEDEGKGVYATLELRCCRRKGGGIIKHLSLWRSMNTPLMVTHSHVVIKNAKAETVWEYSFEFKNSLIAGSEIKVPPADLIRDAMRVSMTCKVSPVMPCSIRFTDVCESD